MEKELTLKDVAGYATERVVWQMMLNLSANWRHGNLCGLMPDDVKVKDEGLFLNADCLDKDKNKTFGLFDAPEMFGVPEINFNQEKAEVWTLGALAFYALMGISVFEGKGGKTQTCDTEVPRISSAHANGSLSSLIFRCLNYSPSVRPSMNEVYNIAKKEIMALPSIPSKRLTNTSGKSYMASLVKFWPEEMVPCLVLFMMLIMPVRLWSQAGLDVPDAMGTLIWRCVELRSSANIKKVSRALERDMNWTVMDEIAIDRKGECTIKDEVDTFGLNDIGFAILKRRGGVLNTGGRFRDGRDPRYKYSFIEVTVKKDAVVNYDITGREGEQLIAIIPYRKDAAFTTGAYMDDNEIGKVRLKDGISYISIRKGLMKDDKFTLTIKNNSGQNMAFVIINYNSRSHGQ